MNTNAIAEILIKAHGELSNVKRNKSGTVNGNAYGAIRNRTIRELIEAGEDEDGARSMFYDLSRRAVPDKKVWS